MEHLYVAFGQLLRAERKKAKFTQEELGKEVGLKRTSIVNIEAGKQRIYLHQVVELAHALNISTEALIPRPKSKHSVVEELTSHLESQGINPDVINWMQRALESADHPGGEERVTLQNRKDSPEHP